MSLGQILNQYRDYDLMKFIFCSLIVMVVIYIVLCLFVRHTYGRIISGHPSYGGVRQVDIPMGMIGVFIVYPFAYIDYRMSGTMWAYFSDGSGTVIGARKW